MEERKSFVAYCQNAEEEEKNVCEICYDGLFTGGADSEVIVLEGCENIYHVECVKEYVLTQIDSAAFPITCPNHRCRKEISHADMQNLLTKAEYQRFTTFEWKWTRDQIPGMKECPNPECNYYFVDESDQVQKEFDCTVCKKKWCLECRGPVHDNYTCEEAAALAKEYQLVREKNWVKRIFRKQKRVEIGNTADKINNMHLKVDEQLVDWAAKNNLKQCTQCNFWVEKNEGCNHMTCRCGY